MVLAFHVVFGAYGFWLPNDPRSSWSDFVANWELLRFGKATKLETKRSVAGAAHDRVLRAQAKRAMKYPAVHFTGRQALAVAQGFDRARQESGYHIHACSILEDHMHLVIGWHRRHIGRPVGHLKTRARQRLTSDGLWHDDGRPVWAEKSWKVFLETASDVARANQYDEANPIKEGNRPQRWSFVTPFVAI